MLIRRIIVFIAAVVTAGLLVLMGLDRSSARNTKPAQRVRLTVLESSTAPIIRDFTKNTSLATSRDGQTIYSLDTMTGDLFVYDRKSKQLRKAASPLSKPGTFAVGPQGNLYLGQGDSSVLIVNSQGRQLNKFATVFPWSIAVLSNGNIVVASPFNGKNLHLYNGEGVFLASFGDIRPFDADQAENMFLNKGRVVIGASDQIYYVSTYAPQPYVSRFSSEGQLLGEFQIEGDAVDLQTDLTRDFLNRRTSCSGGVTIITSATVDPETGHLWVTMNGLSTHGTVYEYNQTGTKLREFAFLLDSNNKRQNVTHVKDIAVSGDSLSLLTWGGTYSFKLSDVLIADAWKVPTKTSRTIKPTWRAWANPLTGMATFWAPEPVSRPGIPQPAQSVCASAQSFTCTANCPNGTLPQPADCGAQIAAQFPTDQHKIITSSSCTAKPIDSTPGSSNPGGCSQTVTWCDTSDPNVTGSTTVNVNCTAVPTPTPTPTPTPGGGGFCTAWWVMWCTDVDYVACVCVGTIDKTPVVIDVLGNGFDLTNARGGVNFDFDGDGTPEAVAWTAAGSDDAFLVLDRNGNGTIDNGAELFGNFTPQTLPSGGNRTNGFLALSEYDKPANGGNGDGIIDNRDAISASLRLWQDSNHNGVSEPSELYTLPARGVATIELDYKLSKKTDAYGNAFQYRAKVTDSKGEQLGRWAWDVIFVAR
jgi:hypothetical protein